jgi:hypothetical protein
MALFTTRLTGEHALMTAESRPLAGPEITRTVELEDLRDLYESPPRAYLAYARDGEPEAVRVGCRHDGGRWLVTLPPGVSVADGAKSVLLIDDGEAYLELRGVRVRGTLRKAEDGMHEIMAEKVVCWDYGSMRRRRT